MKNDDIFGEDEGLVTAFPDYDNAKRDFYNSDAVLLKHNVALAKATGWTLVRNSTGYNPRYDSVYRKPDDKEVTVEHKDDWYEEFSGNVFFETSKNAHDKLELSGIMVCPADYWAQYIPSRGTVGLFRTAELKKRIAENEVLFETMDKCGQGYRIIGWLINRDKFLELVKGLPVIWYPFTEKKPK